jgi:peptide/nickel transport system ATP-binding protein
VEDPALVSINDPKHQFACFFPVGTEAGETALAANLLAGQTAAGLRVTPESVA